MKFVAPFFRFLKRSCSTDRMNGASIVNTPVVVDYWNLKDVHPRSLFFLTHMHADHTSGLTESWDLPIHCTSITAKLLKRKFHINPQHIVELQLEEPTILTVKCTGNRVPITVTAFDANHCPGSAMFLFEGYFGTILYTGDFRFSPSMLSYPALNGSRTVDELYLDNTYCDTDCCFPSREEATKIILKLINSHPNSVCLFGLNSLGKESLLVELAQKLETWVGVSEDRFETLELLEVPNVFITKREECRLRVYEHYFITKQLTPEMRNNEDYIAILPTSLYTGRGAPPLPKRNSRLKIVNYSDHSPFIELRQFVEAVRPRKVRPIVTKFSGDKAGRALSIRCNMEVFDECLDKSEKPSFTIPLPIVRMLERQSATPVLDSPLHTRLRHSVVGQRMTTRSTPKGIHYLSPHKPIPLKSTPSKSKTSPQKSNPSKTKEFHQKSNPSNMKESPRKSNPSKVKESPQKSNPSKVKESPQKSNPSKVKESPIPSKKLPKVTIVDPPPAKKEVPKVDKEATQTKRWVSTFQCARLIPYLMLKKDSPVESGQGDVELLSTPEASSLTPKVQQRKRLHDVLDEKLLSKRPKPSSASVVVQPITSVAAMETTSETVSTVTDTPPKRALDGPLEAPVSKASDTTQSSEMTSRSVHDEVVVPDFLSGLHQSIVKVALRGPLSPPDNQSPPFLTHDWGSEHCLDEHTNICRCPQGKVCLWSLCGVTTK